ncbi:MAG: response regulator [Deltaproteobacteria bacterium]|nr:response regulator [Deltaproteobacteria bacterium]
MFDTVTNESILLVDDDGDTGMLLGEGLRSRGFRVQLFDSASACLASLDQAHVGVVVTDVQMPGMSGIELCSILRARYPLVVPIVLSGLDTSKTSEAAAASGAFAFLAKPTKLTRLASVIREAFEHARQLALDPTN